MASIVLKGEILKAFYAIKTKTWMLAITTVI